MQTVAVNTVIASPPHCGTRFLMARLCVEHYAHTHWAWPNLLDAIGGRSIVVPLRDPVDVWASWCKRNDRARFPFAEFFLAWSQLHTLDTMFNIDVICIDKQTDPRINDWRPVGHEPDRFEFFETDLRALYSLPVVKRHYSYNGADNSFNPYRRGDKPRKVSP